MSSKQILKLPIILEDSEKTVNYYQICDEYRKKAIVYDIKQKQLKAQIQLSITSKELHDNVINNASSKLAILGTLMPLLKKQSTLFDPDRDQQITLLRQQLLDLDKLPASTEVLANKAGELNDKMNAFEKQIAYLESGNLVHF